MSSRNIAAQLRKLGKAINAEVPTINRGGCAVYASRVVAALQARGIDAWAKLGMWEPEDVTVDRARQLMQENGNDPENSSTYEWNDYGLDFNHVVVQFEYRGRIYTHDSNFTVSRPIKIEPTCGTKLIPGQMTVAEVSSIVRESKGWNPCFDWGMIPDVERIITAHLGQEGQK